MATIPGSDHPDRWLYDELQRIETLLLGILLQQLGHQEDAEAILVRLQQ